MSTKAPTRRHRVYETLTDEQRTERARNAALARTTPDAHIRALADAAPTLTAEQRDKLATLLRTAPTSGGAP